MTEPICPEISLRNMHDPARRLEIAKQIGQAARSSGFWQIVDHPFPQELLEDAFKVTRLLFDMPLSEKQQYLRNTQTNRGYDILGGQALKGNIGVGHDDQQKKRSGDEDSTGENDMKEGWMVGPSNVNEQHEYWGRFGHGVNRLPANDRFANEDGPPVAATLERYYDEILSLATEVMKLVALSLDMPEDTFEGLCRTPAAAIRLLHYPAEVEGTGAGEHTDFGLVTLLATSGAPGLELYTGGKWVAIEPAPGAYVCNVGDMLSLYTGAEYKSSLHRVINKSGVRRYSIPFFLDGNSDVLVSPVRGPGLGKFASVTVENHLRTKFDASYYDKSASDLMQAVVGVTA
ncbi:hypothetical protein OIO90_004962 [Microbotryomycetes sp. JL221]|nr:hypothetical protein OIO90_004962 [Microbotryomycetes sp. JL221]